jgi:hypothetical protein
VFAAHFEKSCPQAERAMLGLTRTLGECMGKAGLRVFSLPEASVLQSQLPRPIRWVLENWTAITNDFSKLESLRIEGTQSDIRRSEVFQLAWENVVFEGSTYCSLKACIRLDGVPSRCLSALAKSIRQSMIDVASAPTCFSADWTVACVASSGYCSDPESYCHTAEWSRRFWMWQSARESRRLFVRSHAWLTLLTEHHLKRLGGKDHLLSLPRTLAPSVWKSSAKFSPITFTPVGNRVIVEDGKCNAFTLRAACESLLGPSWIAADPWWECMLLSKGLLLGSDMEALSREADEAERKLQAAQKRESVTVAPDEKSNSHTPVSREYLRTNPPTFLRRRCLPGTFKDFPSSEFDNRIIWRIARPGESHAFEVWGSPTEYDLLFQSPVYIGAKQRDRAIVVADATRVGYDAELGHDKPTRRKPIRQLRCPRCWCEKFRLAVSLECDISREEAEDLGKRPEDLFTWLSLHAWCTNCKWHKTILDEECA